MSSVSIISVNYDNAIGLKKTIESVARQRFVDFELLVIDGGSNDASVSVIKDNEEIIDYWVSEKDGGIYDAMNKGIKKSSGDYLMFLNSGDFLTDENCLMVFKEALETFTDTDIFYGDIWGTDGEVSRKWIHRHPQKLDIVFWKTQNINHQSSFIKRSLFDELGLYPATYRLAGDHWLYLKSFVNNKKFIHINYPLVTYNYSGSSVSNVHQYKAEMTQMWEAEVPSYSRELVENYLDLLYERNGRLVKLALKSHRMIGKLKGR